jgi:hypothetical protein
MQSFIYGATTLKKGDTAFLNPTICSFTFNISDKVLIIN